MVTLSEDEHSWRASGLKRRDFRSSKEEPEVTRHMGNRKKNTKKWCKGKVGTKHQLVHRIDRFSHVDVCSVCQKELGHYWAGWQWIRGANRGKCEACGKVIDTLR